MKYFYLSITIFLLFTQCESKFIEPTYKVTPTFVSQLNPVDDDNASYNVSLNVIQGIASYENGWFTSQKSGSNILLINYLDENGESLFHKRFYLTSHGQDLSLEKISDTLLYLYTSAGDFSALRSTGIYKFKVRIPTNKDFSNLDIILDKEFPLNYTNCTPTISENSKMFAVRSKNTILVHQKENIEKDNYQANYHFELNNEQLKDNLYYSMWFQGIAMKNNNVYCLTGNEHINTEKKIFEYNDKGIVVNKFIIDSLSLNNNFYEKIEPEGLTFIDKDLYFTIMTKSIEKEGNIKYLYKIKTE